MRVLIVKTSSMGDLIHTLPALTDAKRAIPQIQFDWVAERGFSEIPHWHPAVENVIVSDLRKWKKQPFASWLSSEYMTFRTALASQDYDLVIDAQGLIKSSWLIARLAHGEVAGYDRKSAREGLASMVYNRKYTVSRSLHAVERTRSLFAQSLGYELSGRPDAGLVHGNSSDQTVWLIHGTSRVDKEWPESQWIELARALVHKGMQIHLPGGSEAEINRAHRIASYCDGVVHQSVGLTEIKSLMAKAAAVVAVDTGLAHLADALQKKLVMLFGPTQPGLVGPLGANSAVLKQDTMTEIRADQVLEMLDV